MRFENLLHQLIDQHKNLHYVFVSVCVKFSPQLLWEDSNVTLLLYYYYDFTQTPERLPDELKSVENTKSQLLAAGKHLRTLFSQHKCCMCVNTAFVFTFQHCHWICSVLTEKLKLTQLHNLDEKLEKMKNQKQAQEAAAETQE